MLSASLMLQKFSLIFREVPVSLLGNIFPVVNKLMRNQIFVIIYFIPDLLKRQYFFWFVVSMFRVLNEFHLLFFLNFLFFLDIYFVSSTFSFFSLISLSLSIFVKFNVSNALYAHHV